MIPKRRDMLEPPPPDEDIPSEFETGMPEDPPEYDLEPETELNFDMGGES